MSHKLKCEVTARVVKTTMDIMDAAGEDFCMSKCELVSELLDMAVVEDWEWKQLGMNAESRRKEFLNNALEGVV